MLRWLHGEWEARFLGMRFAAVAEDELAEERPWVLDEFCRAQDSRRETVAAALETG